MDSPRRTSPRRASTPGRTSPRRTSPRRASTPRRTSPRRASTPRRNSPPKETVETAEAQRIKRRATQPFELAVEIFKTTNYDKAITEHINLVKKMTEDPLKYYKDFKTRLMKHGSTTSFPEFEGVVAYLTKAIFQDAAIDTMCRTTPQMDLLRRTLVHNIVSIQIYGRMTYPYYATVLVIEEMLKFLDIYHRTKPGKVELPSYYHNMRYRVYLNYMLGAMPENIVFPTCKPIGSSDLIKLRCVPILVLGVSDKPLLADQYLNSPLDFWAHDVQHIRRQSQETDRYYDNVIKHLKYYSARSPFDYVSKSTFYKMMHELTKKLLDRFKILKSDTPEEKAVKQWVKMLLFEIVHEKAWPISHFSLCRNTKLGYDVFPIETLTTREVEDKATGERKTVMSTIDDAFTDPTTLANVYNKMRHGFYDDVDNVDDHIILKEFRIARYLKEAVKQLLQFLNCSDQNVDNIDDLIFDSQNADEFALHKEIKPTDPEREEYIRSGKTPKNAVIRKWLPETGAPQTVSNDLFGGKRRKKPQRY